MSDMTADTSSPAELPRAKTDWLPLLLVPALALLALPFVGSPSTWVTLTVAGLAMGMMIFLMASGLTLVFGLMDIINFGHGVFISLGAYATLLVLGPLAGWATADSLGLNLALLLLCILVAMAVTGVVGAVFERVIVRPVYGSHLKQILVTMGGLIVTEQAIHAIWGASPIPIPLPQSLRGAFVFGDIVMERYRVVAVIVGLAVFIGMQLLLNRTRIGLLIRAGVENPEMVEALGYRIRRLFVSVF
ncbi:MAG: branched-chain amino acid ABC transporter permease, partial [Microvirga sp.]